MAIKLGLGKKAAQSARVEEKYDFPVLTLMGRKKDQKGTASKFMFNKAAYLQLELCDYSRLMFAEEEDELPFIFDARNLGVEADKLKRRFAKTDSSFSHKGDYDNLVTRFEIQDDTVDTEFKLTNKKELEILGVKVNVMYLEMIENETEDTQEAIVGEDTKEEINEEVEA